MEFNIIVKNLLQKNKKQKMEFKMEIPNKNLKMLQIFYKKQFKNCNNYLKLKETKQKKMQLQKQLKSWKIKFKFYNNLISKSKLKPQQQITHFQE